MQGPKGFEGNPNKKRQLAPDPTRSSRVVFGGEQLAANGENNHHNRTFVDSEGGTFHELKMAPERQMAVSMLLKGFVNVASVVNLHEDQDKPSQTNIASYEAPPFEQSQQNEAEKKADYFILATLFNDYDHNLDTGHNVKKYTDESGTVNVLYDFDHAELFGQQDGDIAFWLSQCTQDELGPIIQKATALEAHYTGNEGLSQMQAIERKIGTPLSQLFLNGKEYSAEDFHIKFLRLLGVIRRKSEKLLGYMDEYREAA